MTDRYLEDYLPGDTLELGPIAVEDAEVRSFAARFDPQPFHLDDAAAARSIFGGIIASGWHTCALTMRLLVTSGYISPASSLGSPGVDELRFVAPVRPGDELTARVTVLDARASRSKPDRGIVRSGIELRNQHAVVVLTMTTTTMAATRPA